MRPPRDRRLRGRRVPPRREGVRGEPRAGALIEYSPRVVGVYETVLYASDVATAARFYSDELGLTLLGEPTELSAAFRLPDAGVLLIFDPAHSSMPGRPVPSHGATGAGHVAFTVEPGRLDAIAVALGREGVAIEQRVTWDEGGRSVYLRDPAGNSVELIEGEAWPLTGVQTSG